MEALSVLSFQILFPGTNDNTHSVRNYLYPFHFSFSFSPKKTPQNWGERKRRWAHHTSYFSRNQDPILLCIRTMLEKKWMSVCEHFAGGVISQLKNETKIPLGVPLSQTQPRFLLWLDPGGSAACSSNALRCKGCLFSVISKGWWWAYCPWDNLFFITVG